MKKEKGHRLSELGNRIFPNSARIEANNARIEANNARIEANNARIEANKDKMLEIMKAEIETLKKLKAAYEESIETQKEILMLSAKDKQAMKEKIDKFEAEFKKESNHHNNIENQ